MSIVLNHFAQLSVGHDSFQMADKIFRNLIALRALQWEASDIHVPGIVLSSVNPKTPPTNMPVLNNTYITLSAVALPMGKWKMFYWMK